MSRPCLGAPILVGLALLAPGAGAAPDVSWVELWLRLDAVEAEIAAGERPGREWTELRAEAERAAASWRGAVLALHLDRLAGDEPYALPEFLFPARYEPVDAWALARAVEPGVIRARAFERALTAAVNPDSLDLRLRGAYGAFTEDVGGFRLDAARILGEAMHQYADAQWSALSLALLCTRQGAHERADEVLTMRFEGAESPGDRLEALERRAIARMGAGRTEAALDDLGRALALGGSDARQILARRALTRGELERARRVFASLLPPMGELEALARAPWALRGWGLAMLPRPPEPMGPAAPQDGPDPSNPGNPRSQDDY